MINVVVAFDDKDFTLGKYFEECQQDMADIFAEQSHVVKYCSKISSHQCNTAYINTIIPPLNHHPFIFVAYTHGISDGLRCGGSSFVSASNSHHFLNSFFYSTACHIGKKLSTELINKGCKAFIGFRDESKVIFSDTAYKQIFLDCDNFALKG